MAIGKLDHYTIRTTDLEASRKFYTEVMGFTVGHRPPFNFPGIWLYNGTTFPETYGVVHIIGVDPNDKEALNAYMGDRYDVSMLKGTGTVDHMAFRATGFEETKDNLRKQQVPFREATVPNLGLHQVFLEDPSDVTIELNFFANDQG
ncbi:MAG: glyoxalase [Betaproteobacteria bacterium]|nr:glyoxalase [Betaproteobacteria bacterium]